ncbi:MAG: hypothetical protein HY645_02790 [Acidobacteria bacterium]|nr:hypothetical protein [Acidobacteriota bacterium]
MKKTLFVVLLLWAFLAPVAAHEATLSHATLKTIFPEAENFITRKKVFSAQEVARIEKTLQSTLPEADKNLTMFVAVAKDPKTQKPRSLGAVLMVDAQGAQGPVDLAVSYRMDGSVRKVVVLKNDDDKKLESPSFLRQFEGKGPSSGWEIGKDLQLSGNTTSSKAVILAVRRGMQLFQAVRGQ